MQLPPSIFKYKGTIRVNKHICSPEPCLQTADKTAVGQLEEAVGPAFWEGEGGCQHQESQGQEYVGGMTEPRNQPIKPMT